MKKRLPTSLPVLLFFLFSGCSNDLLTLEPLDQSSVNTYWTSESNAAAALTGCYQTLVQPYASNRWMYKLEQITPNAFEIDNISGASSIAMGNNTPSLQIVNHRYQMAYEGIGRTNLLLANLDQVPMDENLKRRFKGEAQFLRAYYYLNLVHYFGGVPLILDPPNNNTQGQLPRNTKEEVFNAIYSDLDAAAELLPARYPNSDLGRATKGAALAMKARAALYKEDWASALTAARKVVDLNVYSLFPNYRNLFLVENERNQEVIFDVAFRFPEQTNNYQVAYLEGNVLKDLVDAYLMKDGQPRESSSLYDPANPYKNRDPRLNQTLITIGSKYNGEVVTGNELFADLTGFSYKKYTQLVDDTQRAAPAPGQDEINPIVMRYAEVLLTIAEAENELNGATPVAYQAFNQVRKRPSVSMPDLMPGLGKAEFREALRLERRIEFAGEGLYYADMLRWRTAETQLGKNGLDHEGEVVEIRIFDPARDYLWPIPDQEILLNTNLAQNPGY